MNICCRQPHFAFHQLLVLRPGSTNLRESFAALVAGKLSMVYGLVKQWNWWTDKTSTQPMESWAAHYCTLSLMNQDLSADWSVRTWSFVIFIDSQQSTHVSTDTFFLRLIFRRTIRTALASCATWLKLCRRGTALFVGTRRMRHILRVSFYLGKLADLPAACKPKWESQRCCENDADAARFSELQLGVLYNWKTTESEFPSISELCVLKSKHRQFWNWTFAYIC